MVFLNGVFLIWPLFFRFLMIFLLKMVFISCVFDSRNQSIVQFGTIAMVLWCGVYVWKLKMVLWWMVPLWCFMVPGTGLLWTKHSCSRLLSNSSCVNTLCWLSCFKIPCLNKPLLSFCCIPAMRCKLALFTKTRNGSVLVNAMIHAPERGWHCLVLWVGSKIFLVTAVPAQQLCTVWKNIQNFVNFR